MMKKFRKWLIDRFLPRWAYESLLDELAAANKKQEAAVLYFRAGICTAAHDTDCRGGKP